MGKKYTIELRHTFYGKKYIVYDIETRDILKVNNHQLAWTDDINKARTWKKEAEGKR